MSIKKLLIKNTSINIVGYLYLLFASFLTVPYILYKLGSHNYGVLILFTSLIPLASTLDLGISQALIRQLALPNQDLKTRTKYWQTGLWIYLVSAVVVGVIFFGILWWLFLFSNALSGYSQSDFLIVNTFITLTIFVNHFASAFMSLPQADQRFDIYNLRTMIAGTGNTLFTALLVTYTQDVKNIVFVQFIFYLLTFFSLLSYAKKTFNDKALVPKFHAQELKEMILYGLKNFVGNLANQINYQTSKYIIGGYLSAQAVTIFSIPQTIVMKAAGGISQLTLAFFPLSASLSSKERFQSLKKLSKIGQITSLILGIIGICFVHMFGFQFLNWWLKNPTVAGDVFPVLQILSYFLALNVLTPLPSTVLNGLNYPHLPSYSAVMTTVLNIALIIYFVPMYGSIGAAYAALISSLFMVPVFLLMYTWALRDYEKKINTN